MNNEITLIDLFSGIGGFSKGLTDAGFKIKKHYFSEIDKNAIANYKHNFYEAENIGSVTDFRGNGIERPDIITFGSPCQDFSLAGKRAGMEGQRSVLLLEAIRIISELKPTVFIWENVKGTFSSNNGADFWAIIRAFANIGNYRLEWQLLNTSWFLPQNRERIYLVGHFTGRSEPKVFPIRENDFRNIKRFSEAQNISTIHAGGNTGGLHGGMTLINWESSKTKWIENVSPKKPPALKTQNDLCRQPLIKQLNTDKTFGNVPAQQNRVYDVTGISPCLSSSRLEDKTKIFNEGKFRRLTEIECERLQGFPDNWTQYGNYNGTIKEIAPTQRYKLIGNAVSTVVVKEIGTRLLK